MQPNMVAGPRRLQWIFCLKTQCWRHSLESNWTAKSSGHNDNTTQAVWRHLMFSFVLFSFSISESVATVGFHCMGTAWNSFLCWFTLKTLYSLNQTKRLWRGILSLGETPEGVVLSRKWVAMAKQQCCCNIYWIKATNLAKLRSVQMLLQLLYALSIHERVS